MKDQQFFCTECGDVFAKWLGQCPNCRSWNTLKEEKFTKGKISSEISDGQNLADPKNALPKPSTALNTERIKTKIEEFDRVAGGGIFPGSFLLLGGAPGAGKSTLALQLFATQKNALYFSGEESETQIIKRAHRMGLSNVSEENIFATHSLADIVQTCKKQKPTFIVVDSIQMVGVLSENFGGISQIRENAEVLQKVSKSLGVAVLVIGHVTKQDEIAGPKILEHIVDAVFSFEGEDGAPIRILRPKKNRFGSTEEVGVFEMTEAGLLELKNPSEFFLNERAENAFGSVITVVREGVRNFLVEVQALTVKSNFGNPRRVSSGISNAKMHLLLAVISKYTGFSCSDVDAYISILGGFKTTDPSIDLAVVAAVLGSILEKEIPADVLVFGEVGLNGEIRSVNSSTSRIKEAEKMGFKKVICPKGKTKISDQKIEVVPIRNVVELIKALF